MSKSKKKFPHTIVWFEIPVDKPERAKVFYGKLFGWKINAFADVADYWHIDTGSKNMGEHGGLMKRKHPGQTITNYIHVPSVTKYMNKIKKLGGKICMPKTAVPNRGYFAVCQDPEKNVFAIWEMNDKAK